MKFSIARLKLVANLCSIIRAVFSIFSVAGHQSVQFA